MKTRQIHLLEQALAPLDQVSPGLAAKALAYVLDGAEETVLRDLQAAQDDELGDWLGKPGSHGWTNGFDYHEYQDAAQKAIAKQSLSARADFYSAFDADTPFLGLLARLGKLLAAADSGKSLDRLNTVPLPDWLWYLINDAISSTFHYDNRKKPRPAWDSTLAARLLIHEGLDPMLALRCVLEGGGNLGDLIDAPRLNAFMREHADAMPGLCAALSPSGRMRLMKHLGKDQTLLDDFAQLVIEFACDGNKALRTEANLHLDAIDPTRRLALLQAMLTTAHATQREHAAEALGRQPVQAARPILEAALTAETSKPVQAAIHTVLTRLDAARDASAIDLPQLPAWSPIADTALGQATVQWLIARRIKLLERYRSDAQKESQENKEKKRSEGFYQKRYVKHQSITDEDMLGVTRVFNGRGSKQDIQSLKNNGDKIDLRFALNVDELGALPEFGPINLLHWITAMGPWYFVDNWSGWRRDWNGLWRNPGFQKWLDRQPVGSVDLRAVADLLQRFGRSIDDVAYAQLSPYERASDILPWPQIWPFFAEHPEYIDHSLGLAKLPPYSDGRDHEFSLHATLRVLSKFPVLPARWLPRVMEIALSEGKTYRPSAQAVLASQPGIDERIIESLIKGKGETRIEAANWLAQRQCVQAIPALNQVLDKESREAVRAALLSALQALGADISMRIAPEVLLAEAQKGLKAKPPAGLAWFKFDAMPECKWEQNGATVDADILRWWIVLACKLKDPGGNALLTRHMRLLDPSSREALGSFVLRQFIAQDTLGPSLQEAIAYAQAIAPKRWQYYQDEWEKASPNLKSFYETYRNRSPEQVFEQCKREKLHDYLGSAISEKGILALAAHAPGHEAVSLLRAFMRDHYLHRAQIEAMLESFASSDDPAMIQLVLSVSRRYRTPSVQEKARDLIARIAERKRWTRDQLGDRTIATANLDDTGKFILQYGQRAFTVTLDADMKLALHSPEGNLTQALPEPRQNDDPALIKEAKSQFSASKKELKQVIDLQTARFAEAMCASRLWPLDEWQDYLRAHPIVSRLIERLVWLEVDAQNAIRASFRPTEDGSLIDVQDNEIELAQDSRIRLGHACLIDDALAQAWVKHFKDYKIKPLFAQMTRKPPVLALKDAQGQDMTVINDREGWMSRAYTLRGAFGKLGYLRERGEEGAFFDQYTKEFPSVGVRVVMLFSGNTLPEENVPAALQTLRFQSMKNHGRRDRDMPLSSVPPVLLAESYADYHAIADMCEGYDAQWEKKIPW